MTDAPHIPLTSHHFIEADGVNVFYREAGPANAPVILLLHGFPTSSFQYRELIPRLADRYHVIAPDLPGFGFTEIPAARNYTYTFESLAKTIFAFTNALKLTHYAMYVFDYGAPTGFRLALMAPKRVTAIISQNGNAYEEGLGAAWAPIQRYWREPTLENRNAIRPALTLEGMKHEYGVGIQDPSLIDPADYTLDAAILALPGHVDIQLDLFLDYANNVKLYPKFQEYFRTAKPPLLAVWVSSIPTSSLQVPKHSSVISPTRRYSFCPPAISLSRHIYRKSSLVFAIFWHASRFNGIDPPSLTYESIRVASVSMEQGLIVR